MAILKSGQEIGVCVHHSVYTPAKNISELRNQASLFNSWHKSKSWAEDTKTPSAYPYISYHYLMATNGEMLKVTDEKYVKYHAGDNFRKGLSFNLHGIAVCLTGNYENDKPTDAQMKALVEFIRDVQRRYKIDAMVRGHKETSANPTACPGKNIGTSKSGWLKQVIANVNDKNYPPVVKPPEPPVPPGQTECEKQVESLRKEIQVLESTTEAQGVEIIRLNDLNKTLTAEYNEARESLKILQEKYDTLHENFNRVENEKNEAIKKLAECKEECQGNVVEKFVGWFREVLTKILGDRS